MRFEPSVSRSIEFSNSMLPTLTFASSSEGVG
jgi:hypothetical protein